MKKKHGFQDKFNACCSTARDGLGGAIISHVGCLSAPFVAASLGVGLSSTFMAAAMYIASPILAVGVTYTISRWKKKRMGLSKIFGSAVFALGMSIAITQFTGHQHQDHDVVNTSQAKTWFDKQPKQTKELIRDAADQLDISVEQYIREQMCLTLDRFEKTVLASNKSEFRQIP